MALRSKVARDVQCVGDGFDDAWTHGTPSMASMQGYICQSSHKALLSALSLPLKGWTPTLQLRTRPPNPLRPLAPSRNDCRTVDVP